ncbi:MAG: xanthine dehydrogenase family protein subunit M [Herminiimonas sp.]|nr:xanthine dehydrogenase family protein subunit M [Herminiimonas sp.]
MKAPAFEYIKPHSLEQVFALLAEYGDEARLLAGGQTLMATLNMRLSEPALVVDINGIDALRGIAHDAATGMLRIGALVTHSEIEASALVARHAPLLAMAVGHIAHRAIRNLGTWGGSLAYADPAAEWPACVLALDAVIVARSSAGERRIAVADFFLDLYTTALQDGEMIVACDVPVCTPRHRYAFKELARRHGDYAIVGLALVAQTVDGRLHESRIALLGIGTTPLRARRTEALLDGRLLDAALIADAARSLADELTGAMAPLADLTNSAATKRHLACVLLSRSLASLVLPPLLPIGI